MVAIFVNPAEAPAPVVTVLAKNCFVVVDDVRIQCDSCNDGFYHTARLKRVRQGAISKTIEIVWPAVFRVELRQ